VGSVVIVATLHLCTGRGEETARGPGALRLRGPEGIHHHLPTSGPAIFSSALPRGKGRAGIAYA
jgi:hypothetical protein